MQDSWKKHSYKETNLNQILENLSYRMDDLKKEKFRLEGDLDAVYYERRKELEREEEKRHGH